MWADRIAAGIAAHADPRERILAVYDVLGELFEEPDYRGCAFVNATAEAAPDSVETQAAATYQVWVHGLFLDLATDTGAADPRQLAASLVLLYDGAVATSQMDQTPAPAITARQTAELVLTHAGVRPKRRRSSARTTSASS